MPYLIIKQPDQPSLRVNVRDGLSIGRDDTNDIILTNIKVSKQHARFSLGEDGDCTIMDAGSPSGTWVNGRPIARHELTDGDQIQIGDVRLTYGDPPVATEILFAIPFDIGEPPPAADDEAAPRLRPFHTEGPPGELLGESEVMRQLKIDLWRYAASPSAHVIIQGESGTGKELVVRTLHALSPHGASPLITQRCTGWQEATLESSLFGHVKGAFMGAMSDKEGKFVRAHKGTLFLDGISDLSLGTQAKVLRALEQGKVQPLGSEISLRVDVRILVATRKDLAEEVKAGRFLGDLLYRLNVLEIVVPPLRERSCDIPLLAQKFLAEAALRMNKRITGFTPEALSALKRYRFPGNVLELQNAVEQGAVSVDGAGEGGVAFVDINHLNRKIARS